MDHVPSQETLKWYGDLAREGGPFLIVFVVIAITLIVGGILLYRLVVKPTMQSVVQATDNAKESAASAQSATAEARIAAEAHGENLKLAAQIIETNKAMFEKCLERLA